MTTQQAKGPTYHLDIEGTEKEWHERAITLPELRELAGWPADQQVVLVDLATNVETALEEGASVELKPGHGFGRKFTFKRGSR
jgi:hypothetical protein